MKERIYCHLQTDCCVLSQLLYICVCVWVCVYVCMCKSPVDWGSRIHRLHLCRRARPPPTNVLVCDIKQSDGKVPIMLELWGMWSTPLLPLILLYFDLRPGPKNAIPRWYTGRKWHIPMASNRKRSRGRIKAYDMGQGEGPIVPLQWFTGRE